MSTHTKEKNLRVLPHRPEQEEIGGDEKGMLSNAGKEPGDKELWVTGAKKGKSFKENGVVKVNAAKKFSQRPEEVSNG